MSGRALVTGITGFIGGALARRLLADGWHVEAIVRPQSDTSGLIEGPILHKVEDGQDLTPVLAAARPDIVFHLASLYLADHRRDQVQPLVQSNILFPALLAEAMTATGCKRLINTGTAWQQFDGRDYLPVNLYAATKQAAEDLLLYYADARDLSVVTLRLFDTYGPADPRRKLIRILLDAAASGETLDMSPGEQLIDLTHIEDVITAFARAADRLLATEQVLGETWFVSGERQDIRALVGKVAAALGKPLSVNFGGRPYRPREVMRPVDPTGRILPGWHPKHSLAETLPGLTVL